MARAISVLLAVLVLLGVGWYLGHRPVAGYRAASAELESSFRASEKSFETRARDLEARASLAEAKSRLWQARAELLIGAMEVGKRNYGLAGERASRARRFFRQEGNSKATSHLGYCSVRPGLQRGENYTGQN